LNFAQTGRQAGVSKKHFSRYIAKPML